MKSLFLAIGFSATLAGCAPKVITQGPATTLASAQRAAQEPFLVLKETDA